MKLNYSEPKIFTGGVNVSNWSSLTLQQKKTALSKDWFVYFSFRDPDTGKLKKQPFTGAGVISSKQKNRFFFNFKFLYSLSVSIKIFDKNVLLLDALLFYLCKKYFNQLLKYI